MNPKYHPNDPFNIILTKEGVLFRIDDTGCGIDIYANETLIACWYPPSFNMYIDDRLVSFQFGPHNDRWSVQTNPYDDLSVLQPVSQCKLLADLLNKSAKATQLEILREARRDVYRRSEPK